jgi:hypothetical protein
MGEKMTEIEIKRHELLAADSCVKIVLQNDIPANAKDRGLLMESLTEIAKSDKDTKKEFKLKLGNKFPIPIWHCCNIVLQNNLYKDHVHMTDISSVMAKLAKAIDDNNLMNTPALEIVK